MKTYYSVTCDKTSAGQIKGRNLEMDESDKLVYGGMISVIPSIIGEKIETKLTPKGIELEEKDLERIDAALHKMAFDYAKMRKLVDEMKEDMKKMDEAIAAGDGRLNYERSQNFFGYFFWAARCFHSFTKNLGEKMGELLPNLSKEERNNIFLDLITMDSKSYTFAIVEDLRKKDAFEKHPFLEELVNTNLNNIPSTTIRKTRPKRRQALKKMKKLTSKKNYEEIKNKSDLINDMQTILEAKNYYWPKLTELLNNAEKKTSVK